jgi:CheY-like chemotaxis protein
MGEVVYAAPQFGAHAARTGRAGRGIGTVARVLIVDADPAALAAMSQALQSEGHRTATAFDAAGALTAAERFGPFDVLITDRFMTPMSGLELADTLKSRDSQLHVLYLTDTHDDERDSPDVLERPFSEHDLTQAVASLLWDRSRRTP